MTSEDNSRKANLLLVKEQFERSISLCHSGFLFFMDVPAHIQ